MWKDNKKGPVLEFLGWLLLINIIVGIIIQFLEPYSVAFLETGELSAGYVIYAIVGILFTTPNPMWAIYITLKRNKKIKSAKEFCGLIFHTPHRLKTVAITAAFCVPALIAALIYGTRTEMAWYMFIVAFPVMFLGGGVEEIGWRGFLQPELEKRFAFPIATVMVFVVVYLWHIPLWFQPSSNHYNDSLIGFAIMIFVWAFVGAGIYKATKSVFACVAYHAFINTIGAVYDWNALFDKFPNEPGMYIYFGFTFVGAILLWLYAGKSKIVASM